MFYLFFLKKQIIIFIVQHKSYFAHTKLLFFQKTKTKQTNQQKQNETKKQTNKQNKQTKQTNKQTKNNQTNKTKQLMIFS